jgi:dipeptidyl aminopeptidase/acylaminoacyl peptidase
MPSVARYGSWRSPITAALVAQGSVTRSHVAVVGSSVYWLEQRPSAAGRSVVVGHPADGTVHDLTPPTINVRSRVHEYGGGAFAAAQDGICFSNDADGRLYWQPTGGSPVPLTPPASHRFADMVIDRVRRQVLCVREVHEPSCVEPVNALVAIPLDGGQPRTLVSGRDFVAAPRLSPNGTRLAWLAWDHPTMPWDAGELWVAPIAADGTLGRGVRLAGGPGEAVQQPQWSPDGVLHFISDRSGWWNLCRWRGAVEGLCPMEAEFGVPQWVFGQATYAFAGPDRIVCTYARGAEWCLGSVIGAERQVRSVDCPYTDIGFLRCTDGSAVFVAGSPTRFPAVVALDLGELSYREISEPGTATIDPACLSIGQAISFPTSGGARAYAVFYPPRNDAYRAPADELPPTIVMCHGGPTGSTSTVLRPAIQYWTSRGFAVVDVNYRGSTGYGRAYREALDGQWGIADVDDCVNAARHVAREGRADPARLIIRGSSAGGYTALCALTFRTVFRAGASYYGIGDLEALVRDTHKFEAHYLDRLIGPYPASRDTYRERSPIHHVGRLSCPVIFFQGADDRVVPPSQAEAMVAALRAKGLAVEYVLFTGEQHGFRRADSIARALEDELHFYRRVFGLDAADDGA